MHRENGIGACGDSSISSIPRTYVFKKKKKAKQCMLIILKLGTQRQEDPWYFLTSHLNLFGKLQSSKKSCLKILQVKKKKKF